MALALHFALSLSLALGEGSIRSWSRVATFGRRGELPAELGVFFREPLQLGTPSPRPRGKIWYKELNRGDRGSDYYAATLIGLFVS